MRRARAASSEPDTPALSEPVDANGATAPDAGAEIVLPAGVDLDAMIGERPTTQRRGRLRRRLRHLRRVREVLLRDLGGLVFEIHKVGEEAPADAPDRLVTGKLARLAAVDAEIRELEDLLSDRRRTVLREPGIGGTCPLCGELFGSDARYCWACGTPVAPGAARPVVESGVPAVLRRLEGGPLQPDQPTAAMPTEAPAAETISAEAVPRPAMWSDPGTPITSESVGEEPVRAVEEPPPAAEEPPPAVEEPAPTVEEPPPAAEEPPPAAEEPPPAAAEPRPFTWGAPETAASVPAVPAPEDLEEPAPPAAWMPAPPEEPAPEKEFETWTGPAKRAEGSPWEPPSPDPNEPPPLAPGDPLAAPTKPDE